jgi:hypothetical protein
MKVKDSPGLKVTVCVPSAAEVKALFAHDLVQMMTFTTEHYVKKGILASVEIAWQVSTYIHTARQILADAAMNVGSHYTLFIDSDMRFPPDAIVQLIKRNEAIVGANYSSRTLPARPVAIKRVTGPEGEPGELLYTRKESEGLEEVEALGFGLVMIRHDVFTGLPAPSVKPWFWFDWIEGVTQIGEDVHFCNLAREHGFKIYVDHDLSKCVYHIGEHYFDYVQTLADEDDE